MSIIGYISEKKAMFKNKIESNRTKSMAKKETRLKELEIKNKVRENDMKIERQLRVEEDKARGLKKESFKSGLAGRIAGNIKSKYQESKRATDKKNSVSNNIWTTAQKQNYDNPFSSNKGFGSAPFSKGSLGKNVFSSSGAEKNIAKAKTKRVTIIKY